MAKKKRSRWGLIIGLLFFLFFIGYLFSTIISVLISTEDYGSGNVAIIPVSGVILTQGSTDLLGSDVADSTSIVALIEEAAQNPSIEAIVIEINSPGGAPVASDEIAKALQSTNKTTVAHIREIGTSGAYWIASATDHVVANRMSLTGSIGVIGSYLDFSGFLTDWNISYERMVAGKYKDMGSPLRSLTPQERRIFQKKLDLLHQEFKDAVAQNRNLSRSQMAIVGEGEFYLGSEAYALDLVDELGGKAQVEQYLLQALEVDTVEFVRYEQEPSLFDLLAGVLNDRSFHFGLGYAQGQHLGMLQ